VRRIGDQVDMQKTDPLLSLVLRLPSRGPSTPSKFEPQELASDRHTKAISADRLRSAGRLWKENRARADFERE